MSISMPQKAKPNVAIGRWALFVFNCFLNDYPPTAPGKVGNVGNVGNVACAGVGKVGSVGNVGGYLLAPPLT